MAERCRAGSWAGNCLSSWSVLWEWGPGQPCMMDFHNWGTGGTVEVMKGGSWRNNVTGSRLLSQNGNPVSGFACILSLSHFQILDSSLFCVRTG